MSRGSAILRVARTLHVPPKIHVMANALLAVRGAGKTNAGRVLAEEFFYASLPFVAIDPVGSWYGLRSGRDGKPKGGLPVFIFGGEHGDVEITRGSGEIVADTIIQNRLACVIDLSLFESEADKKAFLLAFAKRLYFKNKDPLHLFLEEADDYLPQKPMRDELHLLRVFENIVRRGRSRGLGITLITQRSAVVNKNVLTQVENLFVLRTTGPQDVAAIERWVHYHKVDDSMMESLGGLDDGEAWVWSPHFLKEFKRFKFRRSHTFDSGATPDNYQGTKRRRMATLRSVNVAKLKGRIEETIEHSKQENPAHLRAENAKLKAEIQQLQQEVETLRKKVKQKPVRKIDLDRLDRMVNRLRTITDVQAKTTASIVQTINGLQKIAGVQDRPSNERVAAANLLGAVDRALGKAGRGRAAPTPAPPVKKNNALAKGAAHRPQAVPSGEEIKLGPCARAQLNALAAAYPNTVTDAYLSHVTGYSKRSSNWVNSMSKLRSEGFVTGSPSNRAATETGVANAGAVEPLPSGDALYQFWLGKLSATPRAFLEVHHNNYPNPVTKQELAEQSGRSLNSSNFVNSLSRLRQMELITGDRGQPTRLSDNLADG